MKRYMFICMACMALAALTSLSAAAQTEQDYERQFSGSMLIVKCEKLLAPVYPVTPQDAMDLGYCAGMVGGVAFGLQSADWLALPKNNTGGQLVRVVLKYLKDHPERLAERDCVLTEEALLAAFPGPEVIKRRNQNK